MKNIKHIVFSRVTLISVLVLFQVGFMLLELLKLGNFYVYISLLLKCISILVTFYLICKPMNPEMKIAWIVPVLLFPLFGGLIYLLYGYVIIPTKLYENMKKVENNKVDSLEIDNEAMAQLKLENKSVANQCQYIEHFDKMPVCKNSRATYLSSGTDYFKALIHEIKKAKKFIFLEYFIIKEGEMWDTLHQLLKQKVKQGVEVRLVYDDVGSGFSLPNYYWRTLEKEGIKSVAFNRLFPLLAIILNNRDHRKIVVIDGVIAFTGGINIADEYINKKKPYGYWKDTGIMVQGEAVWNFTVMFLQLWNAARYTEDNYLPYKATLDKETYKDGYIQPYSSTPLQSEHVGEMVYFNMLNSANHYIYIYTPYLIIDHDMTASLIRAAKRGVDVRIVTPGIPDKKQVYWVTQTYYKQLLDAGVTIMQYKPGFIHAKCVLCDDTLASIGTINFDYRSFYHHFECSVLLYESLACEQLRKDMETTFKVCEVIDEAWCNKNIRKYPLFGLLLKLFSPLL